MRIHLLFLNILLLLSRLYYRYCFQNNLGQMLNFSIQSIFISYDYYVMYNINSYSNQVKLSKIMDYFYLFLYFTKNFVYFFVILLNFILFLFFYKDSNLIDLTYQFATFYENIVQILHNHLLYLLHLIYDIDYFYVDCIVYYYYYGCYYLVIFVQEVIDLLKNVIKFDTLGYNLIFIEIEIVINNQVKRNCYHLIHLQLHFQVNLLIICLAFYINIYIIIMQ